MSIASIDDIMISSHPRLLQDPFLDSRGTPNHLPRARIREAGQRCFTEDALVRGRFGAGRKSVVFRSADWRRRIELESGDLCGIAARWFDPRAGHAFAALWSGSGSGNLSIADHSSLISALRMPTFLRFLTLGRSFHSAKSRLRVSAAARSSFFEATTISPSLIAAGGSRQTVIQSLPMR
jgi:hypothetical protein